MNIEKKYYHVEALEELQKVKTRQSKLNGAASSTLWENMTPFMQGVHQQHNGNNPYDGMSVYEARQEAARLDAAKAAMLPKIANAFKMDWTAVKGEKQDLDRAKVGATDRAAKRWDYARLEYERKSARDFLSGADLTKIEKKYKEIDMSGDTHALRGFAEEAIADLDKVGRYHGIDVIRAMDLRQELEKTSDQVIKTKEMRDLEKQSSVLTGKIADLYDATRKIQSEYSKSFESPKDANGNYDFENRQPDPFEGMTKGVTITRTVDPTKMLEMTTKADLKGPGWEGDAPEQKWKSVEVGGQYFRTPA